MNRTSTSTTALSRVAVRIALLAALLFPAPSFAIVGGAGADANTASSPWAGVGSVHTAEGNFSGALIAPGYVLTAAHVVVGQADSSVSFQINAGASTTLAASRIYIHPNYAGFVPDADGTVHNDLAVIRLAGMAPAGVPWYGRYDKALNAHDVLTFVGYAGSATEKRTGQNRADYFFSDASGGKEVYLFDYDGPELSTNRIGPNVPVNGTLGASVEATLSGGDSGSPAFIRDADGSWKLAAINTFVTYFANGQTSPGRYGTGGGGQVVAAYSPWIDTVIASPQPATHAWLLWCGLALAGWLSLRRWPLRRQSVRR